MNENSKVVILDSYPLGEICSPIRYDETKPLIQFLRASKIALRVAKITDYELRRQLTLQKSQKGINNLNKFKQKREIIAAYSFSY